MSDTEPDKHYNPSVRICEVVRSTSGSCGFHLTRSKWDPYPWVSAVDSASAADLAGMQPGDCVLEVNGEDVLGEKIGEVAAKVRAMEDRVVLLLWNAGSDPQCNPESLCCGPMPGNLQRLSAAMNAILLVLECPICLDMIPPPAHQCGNGHLICVQCRCKTERCPICRMRFTRGRSLLADQVYNSLTEAFDLKEEAEETRPAKLREKIFGKKKAALQPGVVIPDVKISLVTSPTNKFLSRLMGKSSSVENLSTNPVTPKFLSIMSQEFTSNLKTKSLSTGEIFQVQNPVSRSPSMNSTHRCGSGFLSANLSLGSKRPASYHGSSESLVSDFGEVQLGNHDDGSLYHCPCEADCSNLLKAMAVNLHLQDCHEGPLIQYFKPRIDITLSLPLDDTDIVSIVTEGNTFFLRCVQEEENIFLWMWFLGSKCEADNYQMLVTLQGVTTELQYKSNVLSLSSTSWTDAVKSRRGIDLTADIIKLFAQKTNSGQSLLINLEITDTLPSISIN